MANLHHVRRRLRVVLAVLLVLDVIAGVLLILPIGGSARVRQQRADDLWAELQSKTKETLPLKGIDQKVTVARTEIEQFYKDRLPSQYSAITDELGKLAAANNVKIATVKYETEEAPVAGLLRVLVDASLEGDYLQEVKFINGLERNKLFFVVDSVTLGEQQAGHVRLQVKFETYLKTSGAA
jgi:type IV pilus assembly protein PilO